MSFRESLRVHLGFSEFEIQFSSFPFFVHSISLNMEMDSHGGLEVTIRQTEWKKKLPNNFVAQTSECS